MISVPFCRRVLKTKITKIMKKVVNGIVVECDVTDWNTCCGCGDFGDENTDCLIKDLNRVGIIPQAKDDSKRVLKAVKNFIKFKILKAQPPRDLKAEMQEEKDRREFERLSGKHITKLDDISSFRIKGTVRELVREAL